MERKGKFKYYCQRVIRMAAQSLPAGTGKIKTPGVPPEAYFGYSKN
jgi:hypothetical protein